MDIITFIKVGRLKWADHAIQMSSNDLQTEFSLPNQKAEEKEKEGLN
jgi:hypothetical protein